MSKKIAITGTSRGLGAALARRLEFLDHAVFGGARTPTGDLKETVGGHYHRLDVTDSGSQHDWWDAVETEFQELPDIVVANAALINANAPLWEVPEEEFRTVIEANLVGVFLTFQQFLVRWHRSEERKPAVLIALSSGWGRSTSPDVAPYCTTKWGIEGMVKSLAQELPSPLAVVALNPGIVNTEMLQKCFGAGADHYGDPDEWAVRAAPEILSYRRQSNGMSTSVA
jgi:NAD(P)-dependent dehydrogenase (short-subunit alcohol dehydrogenase family)